MVLAAGLLVLVGLALFLGGVVTGSEGLYWACVAVCGVAAAVLVVGWVRVPRGPGQAAGPEPDAGTGGTAELPAADTALQPAGTPAAQEAPYRPAGATALRAEPAPPAGPPGTAPPEASPPETLLPAGSPGPAGPARQQHPAHAADDDPDDDLADHDLVDDDLPEDDPDDASGVPRRRGAHEARGSSVDPLTGEPGEEDVEVTDLLLVVDLADEVLVVDEHPRYHVPGCATLDGRATVSLPMVEARTDGFTPCAVCRPVRHLADVERSRRRAARG
ncbi:hypothetical protein [Geodermatophilus sp. DSM 44513]|uniref:hypothetical protein n=1 Tax=Geodermatophilus sp. DSM 44513 TaxID=1528104 RepID=UPI001272AF2E|nr:hypothetical protein [Geodermatophilus sp. DSM 44513]WNV77363.1 hypothetical protein RTG05_08820 [Geodermatophilus sp. DSM 44513]